MLTWLHANEDIQIYGCAYNTYINLKILLNFFPLVHIYKTTPRQRTESPRPVPALCSASTLPTPPAGTQSSCCPGLRGLGTVSGFAAFEGLDNWEEPQLVFHKIFFNLDLSFFHVQTRVTDSGQKNKAGDCLSVTSRYAVCTRPALTDGDGDAPADTRRGRPLCPKGLWFPLPVLYGVGASVCSAFLRLAATPSTSSRVQGPRKSSELHTGQVLLLIRFSWDHLHPRMLTDNHHVLRVVIPHDFIVLYC